jgi:uncharacterized protein YajQ (UPF0234 family)
MPSFDAYLKLDWHEVTNAVDQTNREIQGRYDFRNSKSSVELDQGKAELKLLADDEMKLQAVQEILKQRFAKRGISLGLLDFQTAEKAAGMSLRQIVKLKGTLSSDDLKAMNKSISAAKFKVSSQIQGEQLRVTGKKRDDLQEVIGHLKANFSNLDLQFGNFRE